jgi:hypothetical protein
LGESYYGCATRQKVCTDADRALNGMTSRKNLQRAIVAFAVVAVVTGTLTVFFGSAIIPDGGSTTASVESELRFYAAWYLGAGLFLASLVPRIERRRLELRVVCLLFVLGGVGRIVGIADAGWPHPIFIGLLALELLLPPVLVVWQSRVSRVETDRRAEST